MCVCVCVCVCPLSTQGWVLHSELLSCHLCVSEDRQVPKWPRKVPLPLTCPPGERVDACPHGELQSWALAWNALRSVARRGQGLGQARSRLDSQAQLFSSPCTEALTKLETWGGSRSTEIPLPQDFQNF